MTAQRHASSSRVNRPWGAVRALVLVPCLLFLVAGCAAKPKPRVAKQPKPWLLAQSLCIFPMTPGGSATGAEALDLSLSQGWESRLTVPADADLVRIEGAAAYPYLDAMTIDLSQVVVDMKKKTKKLKPVGKSE